MRRAPVRIWGDEDAMRSLKSGLDLATRTHRTQDGLDSEPPLPGLRVSCAIEHTSESAVSRCLVVENRLMGDVLLRVVAPVALDWPLVGIQDMDDGPLAAEAAMRAIEALVEDVSSDANARPGPFPTMIEVAEASAPDWIALLTMHHPDVADAGLVCGHHSVLVERDSTNGRPRVLLMGDEMDQDDHVHQMVPASSVRALARSHPVPMTLASMGDGLNVLVPIDADGYAIDVPFDPMDYLRRIARVTELESAMAAWEESVGKDALPKDRDAA